LNKGGIVEALDMFELGIGAQLYNSFLLKK